MPPVTETEEPSLKEIEAVPPEGAPVEAHTRMLPLRGGLNIIEPVEPVATYAPVPVVI